MKIDEATHEDFSSVYYLYTELKGAEPAFSEEVYRKFMDAGKQHIALAKDNAAKAIGLIGWTVWPVVLSYPYEVCFIQDIIVTAAHRKQGVGSSLLNKKRFAEQDRSLRHPGNFETSRPGDCVSCPEQKSLL